jgi:protein TonB
LSGGFFLVLPLFQAISEGAKADVLVKEMNAVETPPPPPPPIEEPEPEPEQEPEPPKLEVDQPPLDLAQLELVLGGGTGTGWTGTDIAINMKQLSHVSDETEARFSLADLDQKPRPVYQPSPTLDSKLRSSGGGTVYVAFHVDESGRVEEPVVLKSSNAIFDRPALAAVKKWRFEPGRKNGQPVRFRMRIPITFPDS